MEEKDLIKEEKEKQRRERRKRRKYRLLILLLLLLGTGTMLATSTYAWFTSNKNVSVEKLKVNIAAKNGIQISADGTKWKSIIQTNDLKTTRSGNYTSSVNQIPDTLEPVSTIATPNTSGYLDIYYGVVDTNDSGDYILTATKTTEKDTAQYTEDTKGDAKFIAFDLFFKVNDDTPVYLTAGSGVHAELTDGETDTGIKNASRIAFVNLGNTADGSALSTIQGLNAGTSSTVTLWEPNYNAHTDAGIANANDVYGETVTKDNATAVAYKGVKSTIIKDNNVKISETASDANNTYFGDVTPGIITKADFDANTSLFTLTKGITKIRIYMWVEGQDVDCENNASGGNINFDLKITTVAPEAG